MAVQLNPSLQSANILGFTHQAAAKVSLNKLQSLSDFLLYLTELKESKFHSKEKSSTIVKIGQWLEGVVDTGWQTIDELLKPQQRYGT